MQDVTERDRLHEQLVHQANHDILTGLPNRALLEDRIAQTLAHASRYGHKAALLCLDLDRFKQINDTYGHAIGDVCLQEIGRRLSSRVRAVDTVARTGGEEFTVLLQEIAESEDAERVAADILRGLNEPYRHNGIDIDLTASLGIAVYPDHGTDPAVLWRDADTAMYRAKKSGGNQYMYVSQEISSATLEATELEKHLRRALKDGGLELHYQPLYTRDGQLCGLEALVRLRHPLLGLVYPDRFIPIAEESGLIVPLGNWVLDECCRQSREWQDRGLHPPRIAFNVSQLQLTRFDFSSYVIERLRHYKLAPSALEMEVTESTVMRNIGQVTRQIDTLARMGIHFSIDDFGTGYSSLAHLHQLPVQTLKIDRSFIERINEPNGTYAIVQAIVFLAHSLGLVVVAEGVEREDQLTRLWQLDCDRVQGYYFAPPLPAHAIVRLMKERVRIPAASITAAIEQIAHAPSAAV
jgi:diguanylate cyclase (GGDEF)-like protein